MNDIISIIVPIYNVEKYLKKCIDSIINQSIKNVEIILIDDGSTDSSGRICDFYGKKYDTIKVIHKDNEGLAEARNYGTSIARGNYIGFVDGDDYIEPDMFELLYNNIKKEEADISICSIFFSNDAGDKKASENDEYYVMNSEETILRSFKDVGLGVYAVNKLYKKEIFKKFKFPKGKKSEDRFIMYKIYADIKKIVYESSPKYHYVQRNESITHSNKNINFDSIEASKSALTFIKKEFPSAKWYALKSYIFSNIGVYNQIIVSQDKSKYVDRKKYIRKDIINNYCFKNKLELNKRQKIELFLFKYIPFLYDVTYKAYNNKKSKLLK